MTCSPSAGLSDNDSSAVTPPEPIAIIGIGCRLPGGVTTPDEYWRLLIDGVDAITNVPADRWNAKAFYDSEPGASGKTCQRRGGFVTNLDRFDPQAFGISPREAASMDPQHRLLLETAWEAIDDAGALQTSLAGSRTAVFVGISGVDYAVLQTGRSDPHEIDVYTNIGSASSIAANRISYMFDLHGPSLSVDTACSSSLVALHLACESIWRGESVAALSGGVSALLIPEGYIGFSRMAMLSPDGRCHAFDAKGNGFVRSEGAGMLLLKPVSRAIADRDRIYAVIRATAVNQDGRTPGITVPSQAAQAALIREACRRGGIDPAKIDYVEAHGTGTLVGDPIEARALGEVLGAGRSHKQPCWVGSCKANVGHLEAASGMAGVIKVALMLQRGQIPRNLHFVTPNPEIDFDKLKLRLPIKTESFSSNGTPALAGVNSFGFGGTNAHAILEQTAGWDDSASPTEFCGQIHRDSQDLVPPYWEWAIPMSARSLEALKATAHSWREWLSTEKSPPSLSDLAYAAGLRRTHHDWRGLVIAKTKSELLQQLDLMTKGAIPGMLPSRRIEPRFHGRLAFIFSGQGPQWWGMGRELLLTNPVFRRVIEDCDDILREFGNWSLLDELSAAEGDSRMEQTAIAQPALFAVQIALAAVWKEWGIEPAAVVGHSVGEVAAAYLAGVFSLRDALRIIFERGRCMALAPAHGRMLAAAITQEDAAGFAARYPGTIGLAAVNSPCSVTLSGEAAPLEEIAAELTARKTFCRMLKVRYAFHSRQMDPVCDQLTAALRMIDPQSARLPLFSTVTGELADGEELGPEYWWQNVRQPVRFADAIRQLLDAGYDAFVELGPHPVLVTSLKECAAAVETTVLAVPSICRLVNERQQMLKSLGQLYQHGAEVRWAGVNSDHGAFCRLPNYPWQRERYWRESPASAAARLGDPGHPLLGRKLPAAQAVWQQRIVLRELPFLQDHRVQGSIVIPATAYLETALAAQRELFGSGSHVLENIRLDRPCVLDEDRDILLQTSWNPSLRKLEFHTCPADAPHAWTLHATVTMRTQSAERAAGEIPLEVVQQRCSSEQSHAEIYEAYRRRGLHFGPQFQGAERLYLGNREALAKINLPAAVLKRLEEFQWHPAALDVCLHVVGGVDPAFHDVSQQTLLLPVEIEQLRCYGRPDVDLWSYARLLEQTDRELSADVFICTADGRCVAEIRRLVCQKIAGAHEPEPIENLLYEMRHVFAGELLPAKTSTVTRRLIDKSQSEIDRIRDYLPCLLNRYQILDEQLKPVCAAYLEAALRELGWQPMPGDQVSATELIDRLGIQVSFTRFLACALKMLADDGALLGEGDSYRYQRPARCSDPDSVWRRLWRENSLFYAELTLLGRCGRTLAKILRGEELPQHVIFPEDRWETAEQLYHDSSSVWFYNRSARAVVSAWLDLLPRGSEVRILELGAGTGGLTAHLLPILPADRTEYVFSDISSHFLRKAEEKFADYPFLRFQRLDLERNPSEQGWTLNSFDVVVASQVLHATTDVQATLKHIRELLAPGGFLVFAEIVRPSIWVDLVFSLLEGWWRFQDQHVRRESPLLPTEGWLEQLRAAGFEDAREVTGQPVDTLGNAVLLARKPTAVDERSEEIESRRPDVARCRRLVFADAQGVGDELIRRWTDAGEDCWRISPGTAWQQRSATEYVIDPRETDHYRRLADRLSATDEQVCTEIIHLWNLDVPADCNLDTCALEDWQTTGLLSVLNLVQALPRVEDRTAMLQLRIVTRGAQSIAGDLQPACVAAAPVIGLGRVIGNEAHQFQCQLIDLDPAASANDVEPLWQELQLTNDDDEVILRGRGRWTSRYAPAGVPVSEPGRSTDQDSAVRYRVEAPQQGSVDALEFRELQPRPLSPGEVEIEVLAAGLNFSDVLKSLGLYPGLPPGPVPLGAECSGRVSAVGPNAGRWKVGDEVIAVAPFSFASHVVARTEFVIRKPAEMTFEEAATLPIAFLTASYALETLGHLAAGERALIHAATGGVGLAAWQIARNIGAEVFATAGSREKRDLLRSLGIPHVMDSRKLDFADEALSATRQEGVDVVLNSLPGEAISRGLSVLRDYGRFLEIGKRDIYQDTSVGLKPFRKNVSFHAIDLDRLLRDRPALLGGLLERLEQQFHAGRLSPLPFRVFPVAEIHKAFRYMQQGRHIGKVVVSMFDPPPRIARRPAQPYQFRRDRSYLITGGMSGFGLACARWMAERGAGELVLMSRRGVPAAESRPAIEDLKSTGVKLTLIAGDVSQTDDVDRVLRHIDSTCAPLAGVIHAAMVLEDRLLENLDEESMTRILAPKVSGAWNLHRATEKRPLELFVMFSSLSSVIGHSGQGNYAAANAFLDQLAHHRRALGLPATTINWGYLGDVGILARNERLGERLQSQGVQAIPVRRTLEALDAVLQRRPAQIGVLQMDWARWRQSTATGHVSPRFSDLGSSGNQAESAAAGNGAVPIRQQILDASEPERFDVLLQALKEKLARLLGAAALQIDPDQSLLSLGVDSLMAVDLRNWIERELRCAVPIVELMGGGGAGTLAKLLLERLSAVEDVGESPTQSRTAMPSQAVVERNSASLALPTPDSVDRLEDAEVDRLLAELLPGD